MMIRVDAASPMPVYEQIRLQITRLVASGQLRAGQRLPPIRQLAIDLGVAKATVSKAYEQLERDAVVRADRKMGTVVGDDAVDPTVAAAQLAAAAEAFAVVAHQLGIDEATAVREARAAINRLRRTR
jgi:GntR family transcriptional regulator